MLAWVHSFFQDLLPLQTSHTMRIVRKWLTLLSKSVNFPPCILTDTKTVKLQTKVFHCGHILDYSSESSAYLATDKSEESPFYLNFDDLSISLCYFFYPHFRLQVSRIYLGFGCSSKSGFVLTGVWALCRSDRPKQLHLSGWRGRRTKAGWCF